MTISAPWEDPRISRGMSTQLRLRRERLDAGEKALGWKIAFGAPASMERLQITAPLVGFLMQRGLLASGVTLPVSGWTQPVVEPEIAVYLGKDVAAGADRETARAAISGVGPAIEVLDVDRPSTADTVEDTLAHAIFQRHVVLGSKDASRAGCNLQGLMGHIWKNDVEVAPRAQPDATSEDLVALVRHVADTLAASGEKLAAGHVIITGSIVPPISMQAGDRMVFQLDPIDTISVQLAAG
jgi:2-keto-4-pentenoate hydratase